MRKATLPLITLAVWIGIGIFADRAYDLDGEKTVVVLIDDSRVAPNSETEFVDHQFVLPSDTVDSLFRLDLKQP